MKEDFCLVLTIYSKKSKYILPQLSSIVHPTVKTQAHLCTLDSLLGAIDFTHALFSFCGLIHTTRSTYVYGYMYPS